MKTSRLIWNQEYPNVFAGKMGSHTFFICYCYSIGYCVLRCTLPGVQHKAVITQSIGETKEKADKMLTEWLKDTGLEV